MPKPTMEGHATMTCPIDFMVCKLFYLIMLMSFVLEGKGMHWILCRIASGSPFGGLVSVSLYRVLALQRATWALIR